MQARLDKRWTRRRNRLQPLDITRARNKPWKDLLLISFAVTSFLTFEEREVPNTHLIEILNVKVYMEKPSNSSGRQSKQAKNFKL